MIKSRSTLKTINWPSVVKGNYSEWQQTLFDMWKIKELRLMTVKKLAKEKALKKHSLCAINYSRYLFPDFHKCLGPHLLLIVHSLSVMSVVAD